jgi:UDP-3-O-[3-hydroxymyristoyl] glucosamine N-acyltransferase
VIRLAGQTLEELCRAFGGTTRGDHVASELGGVATIETAAHGDLAPFLSARFAKEAEAAAARGATLLVASELTSRLGRGATAWTHDYAAWALAHVLDRCLVDDALPAVGAGTKRGEHVVLERRVVVGKRVTIGHGSVIGNPGFGWAFGPDGAVRAMPQLGGVVIEDDVYVGALCTIDAGTLGPTIIRRGAKLDAHCHVGHNCDIGEGAIVAAQSGFAGSVKIGRGVLVGGQVGIADHVKVGDRAKIAAKSGVIGDVPAGAVVAGYPAVPRARWLRGLGRLYRGITT